MEISTPQHEKAVVAIIDDDPFVIKLMSMLLTFEGYEIIPWTIAATAFEMIRERQPDVVTLDLLMQNDWDAGLKVLECLNAEPSTRNIPVIIVSANADSLQDGNQRLTELSYARLVKPIGAHELFPLVDAALRRKRSL